MIQVSLIKKIIKYAVLGHLVNLSHMMMIDEGTNSVVYRNCLKLRQT